MISSLCKCTETCSCDIQDDLTPITRCSYIWVTGKDHCGKEHHIKLSLKGLKTILNLIELEE